MAITTKKTYSGQSSVSTLDSNIRIEQGNGRMVITDQNQEFISIDKNGIFITDGEIILLRITKDGLVLNDGTHDRLLIGKE